ncbi:MAG: hypothetical protein U0457_12005 [Candidatus Sericytochromatia bacterium]
MKLYCTKCQKELEPREINVEKDFALCSVCNQVFAISNLIKFSSIEGLKIDLKNPPKGTWFKEFNDGFEVGVNIRSFVAIFLIPFTLVWGGLSLGGIYGTQIIKGHFSLFESLFGIPFLLGTIALTAVCLMSLFGKVLITVKDNQGIIFTGIGSSLGYIRKFNWSDVEDILEASPTLNNRNETQTILKLKLKNNSLDFASNLSTEKRYFIMKVILEMIKKRTV